MFDEPGLWTDIGYRVVDGDLLPGSEVTLARTAETSPTFLESHSDIDDLVSFHLFASEREQAEWVADQISQNLSEDELRHDDIVVINTDPITTREKLGPIRKSLLERNIMCHVAGVETSADVFFRPEAESVTFTGIFRAKGNEAAMVYIVNGQECQSDRGNLALVRNRLFTAITRSKAWVRVSGVGPAMQSLIEEFERIKAADFRLRFRYPTPPELEQLQIVHRDMTQAERENVRKRRESLTGLLEDLEAGRLFPEDLDADVLARLRSVLGSDEDER
jgi:superfamily I DNA and RNA helicase